METRTIKVRGRDGAALALASGAESVTIMRHGRRGASVKVYQRARSGRVYCRRGSL